MELEKGQWMKSGTVLMNKQIKRHYTKSHLQINPFSITPVGPLPNILKEDEEVHAVDWAVAKKGNA